MKTRLLVLAAVLAGGCATADESELLGGKEVYRIHEVKLPRTFVLPAGLPAPNMV